MFPFRSDLDWATLGAIPEILQTAYGSLTVGLDGRPGQSILIRGGTSSVGMATAVLARQRRLTVLTTTRNPAKAAALKDVETAMGAARDAQKSGDFSAYGAALQHLDEAITKYNNAK